MVSFVKHVAICTLCLVVTARAESDFATNLVSFSGPFGPYPHDDPATVLGEPATEVYDPGMPPFTPAGIFTPSLAYGAHRTDMQGQKLIVTLDVGSEIVVGFDHPVLDHPGNWYGRDLIVYGNAFFSTNVLICPDSDMEQVHLTTGAVSAEPITVSVSSDGVNWFAFESGPFADSYFPTNPFTWDRQAGDWGDKLDYTKPVAPSLTGADFAGMSVADAIDLYGGSAGGTSFDLMDLAPADYAQLDQVEIALSNGQLVECKYVQYISVTGGQWPGEIDATSDVAVDPAYDPGPIPGDLNNDGFVGRDDLDIVLDYWGQPVAPGDLLEGDPSGDGFVGQADLDIVLDYWGQGVVTAPFTAAPEPITLTQLGVGIILLIGHRRKRV